MVYIDLWREDTNGLMWPAGFYLPVPKDPQLRAQRNYDADTLVIIEKYLKNQADQLKQCSS